MGAQLHGSNQTFGTLYWKPVYYSCYQLHDKVGGSEGIMRYIAKNIMKFINENIITQFGHPTHLVSDQGSHFINNFIELLVQEFVITHHKSITYYPQGNG
jgi:hypothetical protein